MISAFGVDHGSFSKRFGGSILGAGHALNHGPGAGGISARALTGARQAKLPSTKNSAIGYTQPREAAKKAGHLAAQKFARMGTPQSYGGYESAHPALADANHGWNSKAQALESINKPAGKAPVGNRGKITGRVKTKKMRANEEAFL